MGSSSDEAILSATELEAQACKLNSECRYEEAFAKRYEALAVLAAHVADEHPLAVQIMINLVGNLSFHGGGEEEIEALYQRLLKTGNVTGAAAYINKNYGYFLRSKGRLSEAAVRFENWCEFELAHPRLSSEDVGRAVGVLAETLMSMGEGARAREVMRSAYAKVPAIRFRYEELLQQFWSGNQQAALLTASAEHVFPVITPASPENDRVRRALTAFQRVASGALQLTKDEELQLRDLETAFDPDALDDPDDERPFLAVICNCLVDLALGEGNPTELVRLTQSKLLDLVDYLADRLDPQKGRPDIKPQCYQTLPGIWVGPIFEPVSTPSYNQEHAWQARVWDIVNAHSATDSQEIILEALKPYIAEPLKLVPVPRRE